MEDMPPGLFPDIKVLAIAESEKIPWAKIGADYVVESTGIFTDTATASAHLKGGAKKVVICALSIEGPTFVYGVNENTYKPDIDTISIADSTTISMALLAKILHTTFGITECSMTITGQLEGGLKVKLNATFEEKKSNDGMCTKELCNVLANMEGGDYLGDRRSCFFDADAEVTLGDGSFKLFAWFNHERSYGQRCTDMILHMDMA